LLPYEQSIAAFTREHGIQVVKMKGRVACEISTCECLIATEAIFQGLFTALTPAEALSLLCCLVNQNKVAEASFGRVSAALKTAVSDLTSVVRQLGELQRDQGLVDIDPEEYTTANVRPSMTEVCNIPSLPAQLNCAGWLQVISPVVSFQSVPVYALKRT
jgi:superfamily II RNA helicase